MKKPVLSRRAYVLLSVLGFGLGFALCVWIVLWQGMGAGDIGALQATFSARSSGLLFLLTAALMYSGEKKWELLATAWSGTTGQKLPHSFFRRHYIWQNWIGMFVPPSLAIILGRSVASRSSAGNLRSGFWNGVFDQLTDFALLCAFLPGSAAVLLVGSGWGWFLGGCVFGVAGFAATGLALRRFLPEQLRPYYWQIFFWSLTRAALIVLRLMIGVWALGLSFPLLSVASLTPIVSFTALIPLIPGNLGLAEWGWVGGLVYAGQTAREAALYAFGYRLLVMVAQTILLGLNELHVALGKAKTAL